MIIIEHVKMNLTILSKPETQRYISTQMFPRTSTARKKAYTFLFCFQFWYILESHNCLMKKHAWTTMTMAKLFSCCHYSFSHISIILSSESYVLIGWMPSIHVDHPVRATILCPLYCPPSPECNIKSKVKNYLYSNFHRQDHKVLYNRAPLSTVAC